MLNDKVRVMVLHGKCSDLADIVTRNKVLAGVAEEWGIITFVDAGMVKVEGGIGNEKVSGK